MSKHIWRSDCIYRVFAWFDPNCSFIFIRHYLFETISASAISQCLHCFYLTLHLYLFRYLLICIVIRVCVYVCTFAISLQCRLLHSLINLIFNDRIIRRCEENKENEEEEKETQSRKHTAWVLILNNRFDTNI